MDPALFPQDIVTLLKAGKIGVIPTDTLYGIVGSALLPETVERIYRVRGRGKGKPCIVLIADMADLKMFDIQPSEAERNFLEQWWPGKISIVFSCSNERWRYLHRGTTTIAFRVPDFPVFQELLRQTGPLAAPSANPQGIKPAETIEEARNYFGNQVDVYVDGGLLVGEPSTVITFENDQPKVLRPGALKISRPSS